MKKKLSITLALWLMLSVIAFSLTACNTSDDDDLAETLSPEEIARNVEDKWVEYCVMCNEINISPAPESFGYYNNGVGYSKFIRCIQEVSFDIVRDDGRNTYHGCYVYDLYIYEDGTGELRFAHLCHMNTEQVIYKYEYQSVQEESIPLTVEEVSSVVNVMIEQDFAHQPTRHPDEEMGFDGGTTMILGVGNFGGGRRDEHLISMWEPDERHPHHHIRTAIEDLVRTHITVEEGRIYRPDLYEEYPWMQD